MGVRGGNRDGGGFLRVAPPFVEGCVQAGCREHETRGRRDDLRNTAPEDLRKKRGRRKAPSGGERRTGEHGDGGWACERGESEKHGDGGTIVGSTRNGDGGNKRHGDGVKPWTGKSADKSKTRGRRNRKQGGNTGTRERSPEYGAGGSVRNEDGGSTRENRVEAARA